LLRATQFLARPQCSVDASARARQMRRVRDRTMPAQKLFCADESRDESYRMQRGMLGGAGRNRL